MSDVLSAEVRGAHRFIFKSDEDPGYTYVFGPVLVPDEPDHQGDVISPEEIRKSAHDFMENSQQPGLMHKQNLPARSAVVVDSFIAPADVLIDKRKIRKGTWMLGMRIYDDKLRKLIRKGTLAGYSIGGRGKRTAIESSDE